MVSVATSVAGPLYLAAVMGALIGRYTNSLEKQSTDDYKSNKISIKAKQIPAKQSPQCPSLADTTKISP